MSDQLLDHMISIHILCSSFLCHMWELTQVEYSLTPPITSIHSLHPPPHSHHSGTSPPGVWPLEGDQHQLPTSVGYDHPEDWVGHGQYRTQPTTYTNELNVVYCWAACVCVEQLYNSVMFAVVALRVCVGGGGGRNKHKHEV